MFQKKIKKIALERIKILFEEAEKAVKQKRFELAKKYIQRAKNIGMRCNVKIPKYLRVKFCKNCGSFLFPGKNAKIKIDSEKKVIKIKCLNCGRYRTYKYKKPI
jgi:ribonuclease P protein subunit RPR2